MQLTELSFSWKFFVFSVVFLFLGFLWDAVCWWKVLQVHGIDVTPRTAITSQGLAIFAKYIPGKAWAIIGRASYVTTDRITLVDTAFVSVKAQIVLIFVGLLIGLIPYIVIRGFSILSLFSLFVIALIVLFLVNESVQHLFFRILSRFLKCKVAAQALTLRKTYEVSAYYFIYWLLLMIGYFFLAASTLHKTSIIIAFALPISTTFGILAVITPGGLGVREGIMVGFLSLVSIPLREAMIFAIMARLWFLLGELFIFALAFLFHIKDRKVFVKQDCFKYDGS